MASRISAQKKKKIKELREEQGLSYRVIAERMAVSTASVQKICQMTGAVAGASHRIPQAKGGDAGELDVMAIMREEIEERRSVKRACIDAGDDVGVARESKRLTELLVAYARLERGRGEQVRPMPSDDEIDEIARRTRARLFEYVERAASGK